MAGIWRNSFSSYFHQKKRGKLFSEAQRRARGGNVHLYSLPAVIRLKEWRRGPAKRPKKAYLDIKVTPHDEEKAIEGIFESSNIGGAVWENVLCRRTGKKVLK